jgi:hypothetical protein
VTPVLEAVREEVEWNPRAEIGNNQPPADPPPPPQPEPVDAFAGFKVHIDGLFDEASNFLDGADIENEGQAEAVSTLLGLIRKASGDADKARGAEKKPHDDAGKAVQEKWKPLLGRADMAVDACKKALLPWLTKQEAIKTAAAVAARQEAAAKAEAAQAAIRAANQTDLAAREAAEVLVKDAKRADAAANRAEKDRPAVASAGAGRAATLRSYWTAEMKDARKALTHYVATNPDAVKAFLQGLADVDVRNGKRSLPGFEVVEDKRAV